ncbi:MAG: D-2-hydroxyacid dehydrogenase [Saprospiraceae bacterium]|nr:D-2-hydroxyacid dehydrogenase [Saprospiraceae bacterium]
MIKILANDGIHPDGKTLLEEAAYQVDIERVEQNNLVNILPSYDVVIVRSATKIRKELIDKCPKLKIIARAGVGFDNIDVDYARSKGITVIQTPEASSQSVAELVFAHMFSLTRFLHLANREMPVSGDSEFGTLKKKYSVGTQLSGKTLGIIGFGRVGQQVARIGIAMGMKILAVDLIVNQADIAINVFKSDEIRLAVHLETVEFEHAIKNSDFITLHVPFNGGKPILGKEEMNKMKKGAILINTSRGGTVDEDAMLEALESGQLRAAGLDVFNDEPHPKKEILNHSKISLTPHTGAATLEAQSNIGLALADQIIAYFGDDK